MVCIYSHRSLLAAMEVKLYIGNLIPIIPVTSLDGDNLVVFYYNLSSEIWAYKRAGVETSPMPGATIFNFRTTKFHHKKSQTD